MRVFPLIVAMVLNHGGLFKLNNSHSCFASDSDLIAAIRVFILSQYTTASSYDLSLSPLMILLVELSSADGVVVILFKGIFRQKNLSTQHSSYL